MPRDDAATQRDDARKRREKRRELRTAIDAARVNQEELQKPECDDLERAVDAADAMNEGVDKPREMCLDMEHYGQLAAFSLERTKRLGPRGGGGDEREGVFAEPAATVGGGRAVGTTRDGGGEVF